MPTIQLERGYKLGVGSILRWPIDPRALDLWITSNACITHYSAFQDSFNSI